MRRRTQEESTEHFFISFTDLLVGVIFLFMLLLMVFALNLKNAEVQKPVIISDQIRANLLQEIARRMQARGTPVTLDLAGGIVRLPESILFSSGQWQLSPQGEQTVGSLAIVLNDVLPCAAQSASPCQWQAQPVPLDSVLIEGHTDNRPFTSPQGYGNWELSAFRAITVYKTLVAARPTLEQSILNPAHQPLLGVSAYADRRPVDAVNLDPNRRIDIRFNMHALNLVPAVMPPPVAAAPQPVPHG